MSRRRIRRPYLGPKPRGSSTITNTGLPKSEYYRMVGTLVGLFAYIFQFLLVTLFVSVLGFISISIFLVSFIIKVPFRILKCKLKKEKLNKEIFIYTTLEKRMLKSIPRIIRMYSRKTKEDARVFVKAEEQYRKYWDGGNNQRYCEICGGGLGKGRTKYCSICRPTYRKRPFF